MFVLFPLHPEVRPEGKANGTPERIRTSDLWFRRPPLYPAELRAHCMQASGGEGGIRTLGGLPHTRLAGEHHRPLGHLSRLICCRTFGSHDALAEEVGFEPTVPLDTAVFKTAAFDHSATPPCSFGSAVLPSAVNCHRTRRVRRFRRPTIGSVRAVVNPVSKVGFTVLLD